MSLNVIVTTFFCVTIPVAVASFLKKTQNKSYLSLSDFKKYNVFHSYPNDQEIYQMIEYKPNLGGYSKSYYTEIHCDRGYDDIWGDD